MGISGSWLYLQLSDHLKDPWAHQSPQPELDTVHCFYCTHVDNQVATSLENVFIS